MANTRTASNTESIDFYMYDEIQDKWVEVLYNGKIYREPNSTNGFKNWQTKIDKIVYLKDGRTITKWSDGETVVVKCGPHDTYNKEYGLVACILKKLYGSWSNVEERFLNMYIEDAKVIEP